MAKLSIGGSALEGVRLIGRRPGSVLAWALAYFLIGLLPAAWVAHESAAGGAGLTLVQAAALFARALPWVSLPAWAMLYAAIYRAVLVGDAARAPFLKVSGAELRQLWLLIVRLALLVILFIGGAYAIGFASGLAGVLASPLDWIVRIAAALAILAGAIAVYLRLSMAAPMTFAEGKSRFFKSWPFTRGRLVDLFWLALLALLATIVTEILAFMTLTGLLEMLAGMLRWRADQLTAAFQHPLSGADTPWLVGLGLGYSLMCVVAQCVAIAPWARAYQILAGAPEAVPAPAPLLAGARAFGPLPAGARLGPGWTPPVILVLAMSLAMGIVILSLIVLSRLFGSALASQTLDSWLGQLGFSLGFDLLAVALLLIWITRIERRPLSSAGFGGRVRAGDLGWFAGGAVWAFALALGLGLAAQAVIVAAADPGATAGSLQLEPEAMTQAPFVLLVIVLLAFSEEVMFRGWLLSALAPRTGIRVAIAVSSVMFAAFHVLPWELGDPARLISFLSYVAVGAGFAAVALGRGQIWSSTALHAGYNSFLAFASMAAEHATPQKLWGAVSEQRRGSTEIDQALMTLGLNLAIAAVLIGLLLAARRRASPLAFATPAPARTPAQPLAPRVVQTPREEVRPTAPLAAFSASQAAFEGFRVVRREPAAIAAWSVVLLIVSVLTLVLLWPARAILAGSSAAGDAAQNPAFWGALAQVYAIAIPLDLIGGSMICCAVYRSVLRPNDRGWVGRLRFGSDELRMIGLWMVLGLLYFAIGCVLVIALLIVAGLVAAGMGTAHNAAATLSVLFIAYLLVICALIWLGVRFSLAAPMTFAKRRLLVFEGWTLTRGRFWPLVGCYFLAFVFGVMVSIAAYAVFAPVGLAAAGGSIQAVAGLFTKPDYGSLQAYFSPVRIAYTLFAAPLAAIAAAIRYAPAASAYKAIAGAGGERQADRTS